MIDHPVAENGIESYASPLCSDLRVEERELCDIEAHVLIAQTWMAVPCFIENISVGGAKIRILEQQTLPKLCSVLIPISQHIDEKRHCEILWTDESVAGLRFLGERKR